MSKAEKYIELVSDENGYLCDQHALKAVEIAREETYDKIRHWLLYHINDYVVEGKGRDIDLMFDDIKQAMKDE